MGDIRRNDCYANHALIMVERLAHLQIGWVTFFGVEAMIGEDPGSIFKTGNQRMKLAVMDNAVPSSQPTIWPRWLNSKHSLSPTIQRWLE